jgi:hypothetical protein
MTKSQIDRLLDILERAVKVAEQAVNPVYHRDNEPVELYQAGRPQEPESPEAYSAFEGPGRFESQFQGRSSST